MFCRLSRNSRVERILLVSLTNIGDVIMTFPVFDVLRERFPQAEISLVVGPKARGLLEDNPHVQKLYVYDKRAGLKERWHWLQTLRKENFDLLVDLRNSMLPFLVKAGAVTPPVFFRQVKGHMKDLHMGRLDLVLDEVSAARSRLAFYISSAKDKHAQDLLGGVDEYVVLAPGAADDRKRWPADRFAALLDYLTEQYKVPVVLVGDGRDAMIAESMLSAPHSHVVNITGQTDLPSLGAVLRGARLAITNDSGIMHMASYMNTPVIALFGPTDPDLYGPWSSNRYVLRQGVSMSGISVEDVCSAVDDWFHGHALV